MNIPKLRFPEFNGEWEEKKLDSLSLINPKPGDLPEIFSYIDLESVKNGVLLQEKIIKKEEAPSRAQRLLEEKDILFQTVRPYQRNNYFFNSKSPTVASTGYAQFRVNKNNYPSFLYQYLYTNNFVKNVLDRCSGTSFPAISTNDLLEICLHIPSLAEQQKIADFLSNVDSVITAETKILNTLQKKKKALMQKLFTRQLRFKSDDGTDFPAWEEKKLGECVEILDSQRKPIESKERANRKGIYPYYGASGIIDYIDDYLFEGESILLGEDGANIINRNSRLAFIATGKYWVNNHAHIMKANADNLNYFICEYLESLDYSKICAGSAQPKLTQDVIRNLTIKAPCKEEQQKIADCLSSMDSLIQNQQKVVTTWQQRKKALLQQMFV